MTDSTQRCKYKNRWGALDTEFSPWRQQYMDVSENVLPVSGRFLQDERNKGNKRFNNIYDSTGTLGLDTLSAGLMAGMTSPARPWFRLSTPDTDLMKFDPVKLWLSDVTRLMQGLFARSNTYRALHSIYEELGAYGTGCSLMVDDFNKGIHHHTMTAGEYRLATDYKGNVNTMYRTFQKTVAELVREFGLSNCSQAVKNMFAAGTLDGQVRIIHLIEPREDRDPTMRDNRNMPWRSLYFEEGSDSPEQYLRESGYKDFRVLAPRWATHGGDVYGTSPAMRALGDIRQLQHQQLRKAQAIDYQVNPPIGLPTAAKNGGIDYLPGGVSYFDSTSPGAARSLFDVNLRLDFLLADIVDVRERVNANFYVDLFKMLAQNDRGQMTATEVAERHEEKLLMLGPVLERQHNELLSPKIDMTFARMIEAGMVPPPPPELEGVELEVEFVSMLAQAQRAIGTNSIDRFVMTLGTIAQMGRPEILDKLNADEVADAYGEMLGVDPHLITADKDVALIRKSRADAQQAANQAAMMESQAKAANLAAGADTNGKNALTDAVGMFSQF